MSPSQQLLRALRDHQRQAGGNKRVQLAKVWQAFRRALSGYIGDPDARARLATLLAELAAADTIALPRTKKRWDHSAAPPLPRWVELIARDARDAPRVAQDHRTIAWPAAMAFVSDLPTVRNLDELLAIRDFLVDGGANRALVPLRERSVELFGDEKRLDILVKGALFRPGRLTLELLRCRSVAPPLTYHVASAPSGRGVLILENLHSYDSFRRYNQLAGRYRAVAYGHGAEFYATVRDLPRLCAELDTATVYYFGDLDSKGLEIAHAAATWLTAQGHSLAPAVRWYTELLNRAEARQLPCPPATVAPHVFEWLPGELRERARRLLAAGFRAPQELVGWDVLAARLGDGADTLQRP